MTAAALRRIRAMLAFEFLWALDHHVPVKLLCGVKYHQDR